MDYICIMGLEVRKNFLFYIVNDYIGRCFKKGWGGGYYLRF